MTQNLNSVLSGNFMDRSTIKIMDDIIVDGNKDEAENNENEKDKITERPVDDTTKENDKEIHRSLLKVITASMDKIQDDPNIITEAMTLC